MTARPFTHSDPGAALRALTQRLGAEPAQLLLGAAIVLEGEIKVMLSQPGRGRLRRGETNRVGIGSFRRVKTADGKTGLRRVTRGVAKTNISKATRASAPGDPPAIDEGELFKSITHEVAGDSVRVGTNVKYAAPLEYGTNSAGRSGRTVILPRPFMRPALAKVRREMTQSVVAALRLRGRA